MENNANNPIHSGDAAIDNPTSDVIPKDESATLKTDVVQDVNILDKSTDENTTLVNSDSERQNSSADDDKGLSCDSQSQAGNNAEGETEGSVEGTSACDSNMTVTSNPSNEVSSKATEETMDVHTVDEKEEASASAQEPHVTSCLPSNEAPPGPDGDGASGHVEPHLPTEDSKETLPCASAEDSGQSMEGAVAIETDASIQDEGARSAVGNSGYNSSESDQPVAMDTEQAVEGATASEPPSASSPTDPKAPKQSVYHVKWVKFKGELVPIVTQNENGPCPLLAIMNVLLLQQRVKFPAMIEMVTSGQLLDYLADCILEHSPKNISEDARLNYEQNMQDAMAVFHKLQTGLDVNVKFMGVKDFEYTPECIVFDLLGIPLYHGWLVDPESPETMAALGNCSYNQLVEKIIEQKNHKREELVTEALIAEEFLKLTASQLTYYPWPACTFEHHQRRGALCVYQSSTKCLNSVLCAEAEKVKSLIAEEFLKQTASQLTYPGLHALMNTIKEEELCVFFRNNHFSTLLKHKNELFHLVTDQGFLTESNVIWETLSNVEGDGNFVDMDFRTFTKPEPIVEPLVPPTVPINSDQQIDQDYLVALTLQQEQAAAAEQATEEAKQERESREEREPHQTLSDHDLALRLQEEENRAAREHQQRAGSTRQSHQPRPASQPRKKSSDCVII